MELFEEARREGHSWAVFHLGCLHMSLGDEVKAAQLLSEAYRSGTPDVRNKIETLQELQNSPFDVSSDLCPLTASLRRTFKQNLPLQQILFRPGDHVLIHGLSSTVGLQLNGQSGTIIKFDPHTGRYGVKVDGVDGVKSVQSKNVTKVEMASDNGAQSVATLGDFQIGDRVWIHGLTSEAGLLLNGQSGRITSVNSRAGRFGVMLHDRFEEKSIKPANLRKGVDEFLFPVPSSTSPDQSDERPAQTGTAEIMSEVELANAQVSAFLPNRDRYSQESLLLLTFDRKSKLLHDCILNSHLAISAAANGVTVMPAWGDGVICLAPGVAGPPDIPGVFGKLGGTHVIVKEEDETELLTAIDALPVRYKKLKPNECRRIVPGMDSMFNVSSDGTSVDGQATSSVAGESLEDESSREIICISMTLHTFVHFFDVVTNTESDVPTAATWP